jgi:uncharacterized RmlC-like cupin family protein
LAITTPCKLIRGGEAHDGKQGLIYFSSISTEPADSEKLCMHIVTIPPGAAASPQYHAAHESANFVLESYPEMRHGPNLEHVMQIAAGGFCYIPAGMAQQTHNPNEQESVVLID